MNKYAPVLITVYHRLYTLNKCIEGLLQNRESMYTDLYIVSDAPGRPVDREKVSKVREYIRSVTGFKSVTCIERQTNFGAHKSYRDALDFVVNRHGRVIFLEDDILPSQNFLSYMNGALNAYENNKKIFAVCAYKNFRCDRSEGDVVPLQRFSPWGYAIWYDRYRSVNLDAFDRYGELKQTRPQLFEQLSRQDRLLLWLLRGDSNGEIEAADVRHDYHVLVNDLYCVYPRHTMTKEMESLGDAVHRGMNLMRIEELSNFKVNDFALDMSSPTKVLKRYLHERYPNLAMRVVRMMMRYGLTITIVHYCKRLVGAHSIIDRNSY